ncbi:unnamed protein product [Cuscuta campestris]|uniref:Uncharacterized protein n=1 Tax=Cuscuta campestris TaxID=132261 RepID=A0A484L3F1_9ASTE|nr:unnamed protein product [Cuscuta campestris]
MPLTWLDPLLRCKDIGVKPTLDHFVFTFKLTKGHKDWASYASLSQRSSNLFTSDKKGSTKDWKPFFVFVSKGPESLFTGSGLPSFRRIPCSPSDATLLSMTHQLCGRGAVNIKEVVTEESLPKMGFEFVQDELRHQPELLRDVPGGSQPDLPRGAPKGGLDCGPFVEPQGLEGEMDSDLLLSRFMAGKKRKRDATKQSKSKCSSSRGEGSPSREPAVIVVENQDDAAQEMGIHLNFLFNTPPPYTPNLYALVHATLGMIEVVSQKRDRQAASDEALKAAEAKQKELQEEVARLMRELDGKEVRCAVLEAEKASLSSEVESVSARVVELEGEKTDLIQQLEVERSDRVHLVEEAIESFKSSPDFAMVAMERMDKLTVEWLKTEPGAQWMVKKGTKSFNCGLFRAQQVFLDKLARLPKGFSLPDLGFPPPCRALAELNEAYKALSANRLPDRRIDWDAPCPLHSLQCMAWESVRNEHLPLLEHEGAYYTSLERWTSESRTNSPVRPKDEVVVGEELGSSTPTPRPAGRLPPGRLLGDPE